MSRQSANLSKSLRGLLTTLPSASLPAQGKTPTRTQEESKQLTITGNSNALKMRAWGKCHPQDCDWGEVNAYAYAPGVSSNIDQNAQAVSALFSTGFSQTLVIVRPTSRSPIRADIYTRFTDNVKNLDGRWTIVDGNHLMFNFGPNGSAAGVENHQTLPDKQFMLRRSPRPELPVPEEVIRIRNTT